MTNLVTTIREYAQDHYYCESWDVVATQWTNADLAAAITGAKTRRGAEARKRCEELSAMIHLWYKSNQTPRGSHDLSK